MSKQAERDAALVKHALDSRGEREEAMRKSVVDALKLIHDEADHIIGTDAEDFREVAIQDAKSIRRKVKSLIKALGGK